MGGPSFLALDYKQIIKIKSGEEGEYCRDGGDNCGKFGGRVKRSLSKGLLIGLSVPG